MFRRSFVAIVISVALLSLQLGDLSGQEPGSSPTAGLQAQSQPVVQSPTDDASLAKKVSFLIGFNMMNQIKTQEPDLKLDQIFEGMKDADSGADRKSYVTGFQMMTTLKEQSDGLLSLDNVFAGMNAASTGTDVGMSDAEIQTLMAAFGKIIETRKAAKLKAEADEFLAKGKAYMAKNAGNPNVKTLENGVQYEVLVEGAGPSPSAEDRVRVNYEGSFIDGTVFDSSINPPAGRTAEPAVFMVAQVVPGFSAALQNMKVGSKWRIVIPGPLGYGLGGRGKIQPNQTLVFEISLLEIMKKDAPQ